MSVLSFGSNVDLSGLPRGAQLLYLEAVSEARRRRVDGLFDDLTTWAARLGCSVRTVQRYIQMLTSRGLVRLVRWASNTGIKLLILAFNRGKKPPPENTPAGVNIDIRHAQADDNIDAKSPSPSFKREEKEKEGEDDDDILTGPSAPPPTTPVSSSSSSGALASLNPSPETPSLPPGLAFLAGRQGPDQPQPNPTVPSSSSGSFASLDSEDAEEPERPRKATRAELDDLAAKAAPYVGSGFRARQKLVGACRRYRLSWVDAALDALIAKDRLEAVERPWGYLFGVLRNFAEEGGPPPPKPTLSPEQRVADLEAMQARLGLPPITIEAWQRMGLPAPAHARHEEAQP